MKKKCYILGCLYHYFVLSSLFFLGCTDPAMEELSQQGLLQDVPSAQELGIPIKIKRRAKSEDTSPEFFNIGGQVFLT